MILAAKLHNNNRNQVEKTTKKDDNCFIVLSTE